MEFFLTDAAAGGTVVAGDEKVTGVTTWKSSSERNLFCNLCSRQDYEGFVGWTVGHDWTCSCARLKLYRCSSFEFQVAAPEPFSNIWLLSAGVQIPGTQNLQWEHEGVTRAICASFLLC